MQSEHASFVRGGGESEIDVRTSKRISSSLKDSDFITKEIFRNAQDEAVLVSYFERISA